MHTEAPWCPPLLPSSLSLPPPSSFSSSGCLFWWVWWRAFDFMAMEEGWAGSLNADSKCVFHLCSWVSKLLVFWVLFLIDDLKVFLIHKCQACLSGYNLIWTSYQEFLMWNQYTRTLTNIQYSPVQEPISAMLGSRPFVSLFNEHPLRNTHAMSSVPLYSKGLSRRFWKYLNDLGLVSREIKNAKPCKYIQRWLTVFPPMFLTFVIWVQVEIKILI